MIDAECSPFSFTRSAYPSQPYIAARVLHPLPSFYHYSARSNRWSNPDFLLIAARGTRACKTLSPSVEHSLSRRTLSTSFPWKWKDTEGTPKLFRRRRSSFRAMPIIFLPHFITWRNTSLGGHTSRARYKFSRRLVPISKYFAAILMYFSSLSILSSPASRTSMIPS